MFVLKPQSGKPIYQQIIEQVRRLVASGQLKAGEMLPSVRSVALEHAVNPMTISKAYGILENEGWLERNPGKPMTVAAFKERPERIDRRAVLRKPIRDLIFAARQLDLGPQDLTALVNEYWEKSDD